MKMTEILAAELEHEAQSTRKMLASLPADALGWKPHEKSMTLARLAGHIAEIPGWVAGTLSHDVLDLGNYQSPPESTEVAPIVAAFDEALSTALDALRAAEDAELAKSWKMTMGEKDLITMSKGQVIRVWVLNHLIHHRGQLSVYLRLKNVPLPPIYGPTADEQQGF